MKYDAFISYRHGELDGEVAEKLHKMLESYKIPRSIAIKCGKKKLNRVFRDRDELPISHDLSSSLVEALRESEFLVVICSKRTCQSEWVLAEVNTFIEMHGKDKVLTILIDGEPYESIPPQLFYKEVNGEKIQVEPLAADIRGINRKSTFKKLKVEILRLIAPMIKCSFDDLRNRQRERTVRKAIYTSAGIISVLLCFLAMSIYQGFLVKEQLNGKLKSQSLLLAGFSKIAYQEEDRRTAAILAMEGLPKNFDNPERPYVGSAQSALINSLNLYKADDTLVNDIILKHNEAVVSCELSDDKSKLLSICYDGYAYVWNVNNGKLINKFMVIRDKKINEINLNTQFAHILSDNKTIVLFDYPNGAISYDIQSGKKLWESRYKSQTAVFSTDGSKIYLAGISDKKVAVYNTSNGNLLNEVKIKDNATGIDVSKNSNRIAVVYNESIGIFDIKAGKEIADIDFPQSMNWFDLSPDGNRLLIVENKNLEDPYTEGKISIYNVSSKKIIYQKQTKGRVPQATFSNSNVFGKTILYSSNGNFYCMDYEKDSVVKEINGEGCIETTIFNNNYILLPRENGVLSILNKDNLQPVSYSGVKVPYAVGGACIGNKFVALFGLSGSNNSNNILIKRNVKNKGISNTYLPGQYCFSMFSKDAKKLLMVTKNIPNSEVENFTYNVTIHQGKNMTSYKTLSNKLKEAEWKLSPDGSKIICIPNYNYDTLKYIGKFKIYDSNTFKVIYELPKIKSFLPSSDCSRFICRTDKVQILIDGNSAKELAIIPNSRKYEIAAVLKNYIVMQDPQTFKVLIYDIKSKKYISNSKLSHLKEYILFYNDNYNSKPDEIGDILPVLLKDSIIIYSAKDDNIINTIKLQNKNVVNILLMEKEILICYMNNDIEVRDIKTGQLLHNLGESKRIEKMELSSNDKFLKIYFEGNDSDISPSVCLYNPKTYEKLAEIENLVDIDADNHIIVNDGKSYVTFPWYTRKMLYKEAKKLINGQKLTISQRKKYFLEQ